MADGTIDLLCFP